MKQWCIAMLFENSMVDQIGLVVLRDMLNVSINEQTIISNSRNKCNSN